MEILPSIAYADTEEKYYRIVYTHDSSYRAKVCATVRKHKQNTTNKNMMTMVEATTTIDLGSGSETTTTNNRSGETSIDEVHIETIEERSHHFFCFIFKKKLYLISI